MVRTQNNPSEARATVDTEVKVGFARKLAWKFYTTTGIDWNDLFQEAAMAGVRAEGKDAYDPNKASKRSFVYMEMSAQLLNYAKKCNRAPDDAWPGALYTTSAEDRMAFVDEINSLSEAAQESWKLISENPQEYLGLGSKKARGRLKEQLREEGWSWPQIRYGFNELKSLVS